MIRIRATDDGTYVVYRDHAALVTGLTRDQAHAIAQSLGAIVVEYMSWMRSTSSRPAIASGCIRRASGRLGQTCRRGSGATSSR